MTNYIVINAPKRNFTIFAHSINRACQMSFTVNNNLDTRVTPEGHTRIAPASDTRVVNYYGAASYTKAIQSVVTVQANKRNFVLHAPYRKKQ